MVFKFRLESAMWLVLEVLMRCLARGKPVILIALFVFLWEHRPIGRIASETSMSEFICW